jgi:hypothetical protein
VSSNPTSITVSWKQLRTSNCRDAVLSGYRVAYRLSRTGNSFQYKYASSSATSVMVTGLHKYTQNSFRVQAYTGTKYGPLSNAMETRTRQDGIYRICSSQSFMRLILLVAQDFIKLFVYILDMYLERGTRVSYHFDVTITCSLIKSFTCFT